MLFPLTRTIRVLADSLGTLTLGRGAAAATKSVPPSTHGSRKLARAALPLIEVLEERALMSTYYVSPTGNDNNAGTSTASAWKSISKVNAASFKPGDNVLFQGGQTFSGSLQFRSRSGNSTTTPVTVGSYGSGRAKISSGSNDGAYVYGTSGIWFENLVFVGTPGALKQDGIRFEAPSGNYSNGRVMNCDISGYKFGGILVCGDGSAGYSNVNIWNNSIHDNVDNGIIFTAGAEYVNKNIYIGYNQIYNNYGDGTSYVTGSGLALGNANNAIVEYNNAYNNGAKGGNGGCGIWASASTLVTMRYNVSHDNHSERGHDGDGFDFDLDTQNSVMEYNYAYNNDGNGFQFNQWGNNTKFTNNVIKYNVSQNNGQKNNYAGLEVWGRVTNSSFQNNVVYITSTKGSPSGVKVHNASVGGLYVSNLSFTNNVFVVTGGRPMVYIPSAELSGAKGLVFHYNTYWSGSSAPSYSYGSSYSGLSSWASHTGQEKVNGSLVGKQTNPGSSAVSNTTPMSLSTALVCVKVTGFSVPAPTSNITVANTTQAASSSSTTVTTSSTSSSTAAADSSTTGWSSTDIGTVGKTGSSSISGSTYSIVGAGADIWNTSDAFHYDYKTLNGDGQIVAKVVSTGSTSPWSKAGVMIRDSNAANSAEVSVLDTPSNGTEMEQRASSGSASTVNKLATSYSSEWVKLVRSGNTFTGYISQDGSSWLEVSSTQVSMSSVIEIGLAVTSHDLGVLDSAQFDNVSIIS